MKRRTLFLLCVLTEIQRNISVRDEELSAAHRMDESGDPIWNWHGIVDAAEIFEAAIDVPESLLDRRVQREGLYEQGPLARKVEPGPASVSELAHSFVVYALKNRRAPWLRFADPNDAETQIQLVTSSDIDGTFKTTLFDNLRISARPLYVNFRWDDIERHSMLFRQVQERFAENGEIDAIVLVDRTER